VILSAAGALQSFLHDLPLNSALQVSVMWMEKFLWRPLMIGFPSLQFLHKGWGPELLDCARFFMYHGKWFRIFCKCLV